MIHLIYNPIAGRGRAQAALPRVKAFLQDAGLAFEVHTSAFPGHASTLVAQLPDEVSVLALGGDGTFHEVAARCVNTERTVGLLPAGTGNDLAFALGIKSLDDALQSIRLGRVKWIDSAEVNAQAFFNAFGSGFDADVARSVKAAPAWLKGSSAYLYALVTTLRHFQTPVVEVMVDDQPIYQGMSLLISVHNGPRVGGTFHFCPDAKADDGLLDVAIIGKFNRAAALAVLPKVTRGTHVNQPGVVMARGKILKIRWGTHQSAHIDGELLEPTQHFSVEVKPKSLKIFAK